MFQHSSEESFPHWICKFDILPKGTMGHRPGKVQSLVSAHPRAHSALRDRASTDHVLLDKQDSE